MSIPRNLGNFADNVNSSGQVSLTTGVTGTLPVANGGTGSTSTTFVNAATNVTGTLPVANGGTGLTTTPANGALDIGNGTGFTRTTLTAGTGISVTNGAGSITIATSGSSGVTSVATGNGLSGGTITSTGTLVVACPSYNTVGSYALCAIAQTVNATSSAGSNYSAGTGNLQVRSLMYVGDNNGQPYPQMPFIQNNLSGTWKNMGAGGTVGACYGTYINGTLFCRVS